MLGLRTEKLIDAVRPDAVFVMTNEEWWNKASLLRYVRSQEEMNTYESSLEKDATMWKNPTFYNNSKRAVFYARAALYFPMITGFFGWSSNSKFWLPGVEMKFACEAAERTGAKLVFLGSEFNQNTWNRLYHETRFNILQYLQLRF